ncbi:hypothetical protein E2C01_082276 [Portunus trituberculatus]|uniref:Uncharacterized protein n=1 Tax=Portunus trituberculatus TaxID=210409 RepID=A0A5B7IY12_PORTR|nr:hypothetical protein [Portunus trituberculatus]
MVDEEEREKERKHLAIVGGEIPQFNKKIRSPSFLAKRLEHGLLLTLDKQVVVESQKFEVDYGGNVELLVLIPAPPRFPQASNISEIFTRPPVHLLIKQLSTYINVCD